MCVLLVYYISVVRRSLRVNMSMKLYEIRYLRDEIINEGVLDRVPARYRKIVGGLVAALMLSAPQQTTDNKEVLQNRAHDAAQAVQAFNPDQYDDLISSLKRIQPIVNAPLKDKANIEFGPLIDHISKMTPKQLAQELESTESGWVQHKVDDKHLMMRPTELKKAEYAIEFFVNKGMNRSAAIGLIGGFIQESRLNEKAVNSQSGAYGIAQWLGDRKEGVPDTFHGQLEHVWKELQTRPHSSTYKMLQRANTLGRLVYASNRYERFEGWKQGGRGDLAGTEHGLRTEYIRLLAELYGKDDEASKKIASSKPLQRT